MQHRPARRAEISPIARSARLWLALALLCLLGAEPAGAYSYSAAGAEPLIDAREQALAALNAGDFAGARKASAQAAAELEYLDEHQQRALGAELERALAARDEKAVDRVYLRAFAGEIRRRIAAAKENVADYQLAKTLVIRSKRFLDLVAPHLPEPARASAARSLEACLEALGNPGLFGVGARAPAPAVFAENAERVLASLASL